MGRSLQRQAIVELVLSLNFMECLLLVASSTTYSCRQCGGVARPVAGRDYLQCEYCRSLVFTTGNPLTIDRITPMGEELDAECPTCAKPLLTGQLEDRRVLYCGGCYGMLLKNEDFAAVTRLRRARREGCEAEPAKPLDTQEYERQLDCPNCHSRMEVHPFYGPGNIVMDSCSRCQFVWLDHGELRTIERSEGGRIPDPMPMYVNEHGDVTMIPPPSASIGAAATRKHGMYHEGNPLAALADLLFGF